MIEFGNIAHGYAIADAAGVLFNADVDRVISRSKGGVLLGGNIYNGYTGESIQLHMAGFSPAWANRTFLWYAFDYPFRQLQCRRVFGISPQANSKALDIQRRLGFKEVARIDGVFPEGAAVISAMEHDKCRWLRYDPKAH